MKQQSLTGKGSIMWLLALMLLFSYKGFSQLPAFTLTVTNTDEVCSGSACANFTASGTVSGATVLYAIYPVGNPSNLITTTPSNSYCGLTHGSYVIEATQSLNGQSSVQQQIIVVDDLIQPLTYTLDDRTDGCGDSGTIIVETLTGHPAIYEIISGPILVSPQASNELSGLQSGTYIVRVTDECGEAVVQTYTFFLQPPSLSIVATPITEVIDCDTTRFSQTVSTASDLAYPLTVTYTVTFPDGTQQTVTQVVETGNSGGIVIAQDMEVNVGEEYVYSVTVSDNCGNSTTNSGILQIFAPEPSITTAGMDCNVVQYQVLADSATVIAAPDAYAFDLPHVLEPSSGSETVFPLGALPPGQYMILATRCGVEYELPLLVQGPVPTAPVTSVQKGCEEGNASVFVNVFMGVGSGELVSAPEGYDVVLPMDVTPFIDGNAVKMTGLVAGVYVFQLISTCGMAFTVSVTVDVLTMSDNSSVIPHCGSFDIDLQYSDNSTGAITFWLQKLDPDTGLWGHPGTGTPYFPGTAPSGMTALTLQNGAINYNLVYFGHFRVVSYRAMFSGDPIERHCMNTLFEFDFLGIPDIINVYSFTCSNNLNDVIVEAVGMGPLTYRITSFNGGPTLVENGTSEYFTGLAPGIYNFQVEDVCHNIANQLYDISEPYALTINGSGLCESAPATISVASFSFLNYSWYKDNPAQVLSTSAILDIPAFSEANLGTYHVHITAINPNSCLDLTLSYTFDEIERLPKAGNDNAQTFCGSQGAIDLNAFLTGYYDSDGSWTAITSGTTIVGNAWNSDVVSGNYTFRYTVENDCEAFDSADVVITILPMPALPQPSASVQNCANGNLELWVEVVPGTTYEWTGPAGFSAIGTNLTIENATSENSGIYNVQAFLGDCPSQIASVEAIISSLPSVSITAGCNVQDRMMLEASVTPADAYEFEWTGPNGFSSTDAVVDITGGDTGMYYVSATNAAGCMGESGTNVIGTLCRIASGISPNDDGDNDTFDLSGLGDIERVKIFNRYGMTVYEKSRYVNEWHGQDYNGNLLPSATYYYLITLANGEPKTGWVYLMRP